MPRYSIITICYNDAAGLRKTLESEISQTMTDYEIIVIDGGSTDGSKKVIEKYQHYLAYWCSEKDKGIYNAMNKGVAKAKGTYCIFMNSGDVFYDQNVLKEIESHKHQEDIITGGTVGMDKNDIRFSTSEELSFLTLYRNTISHQASFIKTSLLRQMPYNDHLKIVADWEFWIKALILQNCTHCYDKTIVAKIDLSGISIKSEALRTQERKMVLDNLLPSRILKDYERIKYLDEEFLYLMNKVSKTYRLKKMVMAFIQLFLKLAPKK
jgi:glycosyltransferase involved in cell wall biosynthesis